MGVCGCGTVTVTLMFCVGAAGFTMTISRRGNDGTVLTIGVHGVRDLARISAPCAGVGRGPGQLRVATRPTMIAVHMALAERDGDRHDEAGDDAEQNERAESDLHWRSSLGEV